MDHSAERIAELEKQLSVAQSNRPTEMNDDNTQLVKMLADVSHTT